MTPHDVLHRCPLCQAEYTQDAVVCLEQQTPPGRPQMYHCICSKCKRSVVALLMENAGWLSSVGMLTEMTADEARRARTLAPIEATDCIRAHVLLEDGTAFCEFLLKQGQNGSKHRS